ncbi:MAG: type I-U CRISPR-associated protein Cas5/Cas6 [Deltaproteobacteria bacterium]|nr:MAG: type I-U CRISPR-associated protein Cas5/Cas6 [Deltaproteobacteria bacterium]
MIALHVHFLTGRYAASEYNDRAVAEWPPHPARLYSALVDALYSEDVPNSKEAKVLDALAEWSAPYIASSEFSRRRVMTYFVPVNDQAVTDHARLWQKEEKLHSAVDALAAAPSDATSKAKAKLVKAIATARSNLLTEAKRQTVQGKVPKDNPGPRALPWGRTKQGRYFPTIIPFEPKVSFVWPDASLGSGELESLRELCARVVRLGHSSSFVAVAVECGGSDAAPATLADPVLWLPDPDGDTFLRTPQPGQREALVQAFDHHQGNQPGRVMPAKHSLYRVASDDQMPLSTIRTGGIWIAYHVREAQTPTAAQAVGLAETIRAALLRFADDPLPPKLSGHDERGPSAQDHLAVLPLPFVGHPHADGHVRGFAVSLPSDASATDVTALKKALGRWERAHGGLGDRVVKIFRGELELTAQRVVDPMDSLSTLRVSRWSTPSDRWATVTPIALDGECHALNHPKGSVRRKAHKTATKLVRKSVVRALEGSGITEKDVLVTLVFDAPVPGAPHLRSVPPYRRGGHDRARRLVHAIIELPRLVRGPMILGSGRHFGLGLCAPLRRRTTDVKELQ